MTQVTVTSYLRVRSSMPKIVTFSMRIPEKKLDCWLAHFFATIEQAKKDN